MITKTYLLVSPAAHWLRRRLRQGLQTATATEQLTVKGTSPVITVEGGEAARYQSSKTLVVHNDGGHVTFSLSRHVFNSKGERVQTKIRPGARVMSIMPTTGYATIITLWWTKAG